MVLCDRVVDNTLFRHVFSAVVFPARAWHVIVVPSVNTAGQLSIARPAIELARELGSDSLQKKN